MLNKPFNKSIAACAVATSLLFSTGAIADGYKNFKFNELETSANAADWDMAKPWKLPKGFTQTVVSNESNLNIYPEGLDDWHDMNTTNETGENAGRFMYLTHEVRTGRGTDILDSIGGTVSVVDLKTGITKILAQDESYTTLDGIRWTT